MHVSWEALHNTIDMQFERPMYNVQQNIPLKWGDNFVCVIDVFCWIFTCTSMKYSYNAHRRKERTVQPKKRLNALNRADWAQGSASQKQIDWKRFKQQLATALTCTWWIRWSISRFHCVKSKRNDESLISFIAVLTWENPISKDLGLYNG